MIVCVGERLDGPGWTGLPLGRFKPPSHASLVAVAAAQDSLFVWNDGASAAHVRVRHNLLRYERHRGVLDLMAAEEQVLIGHDRPDAPGECLVVGIPAELCSEWFESAELERCALATRFGLADPHLESLARALEAHCEGGEPWGKLYTQSVSMALASYLLHRYGERAPPAGLASNGRGRLSAAQQARIVRYIEDHFDAEVGLAELARFAGYSPPHFVRLFRGAFGVSPYRFVIRRRIERAKQLLAHPELSMRAVARACGFANESHFSVSFAKHVGVPPSAYRAGAAGAERARASRAREANPGATPARPLVMRERAPE